MRAGLYALGFVGLIAASAAAFTPPDGADDGTPALAAVPPAPRSPFVDRDPGADVEVKLAALDREERAAKSELARLARDRDALHARTVLRGRAYVRLARAGLLPVAGGLQALLDHAAKLERVRSALAYDLAAERENSQRSIALGKRLSELAAKRGPLEREQRALAVARTALLAEQDRMSAFERAFSGGGLPGHTAVYGAMGPSDPSDVSQGFLSLKGRLPFPISGRSEIRSGRLSQSEGPGLFMYAPQGASVRSVCAGRVAFADEYADYGRTVILDHGGGYYTVSANLGSVDVSVGDDVPSGSRIGSVGDSGSGAHLFFEIRYRTRTLDPAEWFGI